MLCGELIARADVECEYSIVQQRLQFSSRNRGQGGEIRLVYPLRFLPSTITFRKIRLIRVW